MVFKVFLANTSTIAAYFTPKFIYEKQIHTGAITEW